MKALVWVVSLFDSLFVFGLLVFLYVVGVSYFQPFWLNKEAFHLQVGIWWLSGLRNDDMGVIAFVVSFVSFLCGRYLRNHRHLARADKERAPTAAAGLASMTADRPSRRVGRERARPVFRPGCA